MKTCHNIAFASLVPRTTAAPDVRLPIHFITGTGRDCGNYGTLVFREAACRTRLMNEFIILIQIVPYICDPRISHYFSLHAGDISVPGLASRLSMSLSATNARA